MAFPVIGASAATSDITGASTTVTMPSGIVAGNLLLLFCAHNQGTLSASVGWTSLAAADHSGIVSLAIFAKIAAGGDTCTLTSTADQDTAVLALRVSAHNVTNVATDITLGTTTLGQSAAPDPPNCNPGVAQDYLWLEMYSANDDDASSPFASTNFTDVASVESAQSASSCMVAVASRAFNASSQNPSAMVMGSSKHWLTQTLAIPPQVWVATSAGAVTAAPTLTTAIPLVAAMSNSAVVASDITTAIQFQALLSAVSLNNQGSLITAIPMIATSTVEATTANLLSTNIALSASITQDAAFVAVTLDTEIALAALLTGTGASEATGDFTGTPLAVTIGGDGFLEGDLFHSISAQLLGQGFLNLGDVVDVGQAGISEERLRLPGITEESLRVTLGPVVE